MCWYIFHFRRLTNQGNIIVFFSRPDERERIWFEPFVVKIIIFIGKYCPALINSVFNNNNYYIYVQNIIFTKKSVAGFILRNELGAIDRRGFGTQDIHDRASPVDRRQQMHKKTMLCLNFAKTTYWYPNPSVNRRMVTYKHLNEYLVSSGNLRKPRSFLSPFWARIVGQLNADPTTLGVPCCHRNRIRISGVRATHEFTTAHPVQSCQLSAVSSTSRSRFQRNLVIDSLDCCPDGLFIAKWVLISSLGIELGVMNPSFQHFNGQFSGKATGYLWSSLCWNQQIVQTTIHNLSSIA